MNSLIERKERIERIEFCSSLRSLRSMRPITKTGRTEVRCQHPPASKTRPPFMTGTPFFAIAAPCRWNEGAAAKNGVCTLPKTGTGTISVVAATAMRLRLWSEMEPVPWTTWKCAGILHAVHAKNEESCRTERQRAHQAHRILDALALAPKRRRPPVHAFRRPSEMGIAYFLRRETPAPASAAASAARARSPAAGSPASSITSSVTWSDAYHS